MITSPVIQHSSVVFLPDTDGTLGAALSALYCTCKRVGKKYHPNIVMYITMTIDENSNM
jgi:hypothetical protein